MTGPNTSPTTSSPTPTSRTITNLSPLETCCITVEAYHTGGESACSNTTPGPSTQLCSATSDAAPGAVRSLNVQAVSSFVLYVTWEEPGNYARPGLTYSVSWSPNGVATTVNQQTQYTITGLNPSTQYTVTVTAASAVSSSGASSIFMQSTLPLPPTPPTNLLLSAMDDNLTFSWDPSTATDAQDTNYTAELRCDNDSFTQTVSHPLASVSFDTSSVLGTAWCTAVVQATNIVADSQFSERINVVRPVTVPTKPQCYFTGNEATNATVSYTVTYPFALDGITVEYKIYSSVNSVQAGTENFLNNNNNIYITVNRSAFYEFELRLCNANAAGQCGPYCDRIDINTENVSFIHTTNDSKFCLIQKFF